MNVDRTEILALLNAKYPSVMWDIGMTDAEHDDDGEELPSRTVLIANASLHGARILDAMPRDDEEVLAYARSLLIEMGMTI